MPFEISSLSRRGEGKGEGDGMFSFHPHCVGARRPWETDVKRGHFIPLTLILSHPGEGREKGAR